MLDMLLLGLFGAAILGAAVIGNDNDDADTPIDPDQPTEGDDVLTVGDDATGLIDGLGCDDQITVTTETGQYLSDDPRGPEWLTDDSAPPLMVDGGAGNDVLHLSGGGYHVSGGEGADRIELGDATKIWVEAGAGDTVVGGSGHGYIHLTEDAVYQGSASREVILMDSTATADMGAGDDHVWGGATASHVLGGDGNDWLEGTSKLFYSGSMHRLGDFASVDSDTLDGGTGDDTIMASHGDIVVSGEGEDHLTLYLRENVGSSRAVITDFVSGQDRLAIYYGTMDDYAQPTLVNQITVTETDGDTIITGSDGQVLAVFTGATGLTVGIQLFDEGVMSQPIQGGPNSAFSSPGDLTGNPTPDVVYDVVISRFYET